MFMFKFSQILADQGTGNPSFDAALLLILEYRKGITWKGGFLWVLYADFRPDSSRIVHSDRFMAFPNFEL